MSIYIVQYNNTTHYSGGVTMVSPSLLGHLLNYEFIGKTLSSLLWIVCKF